MGTDRPAPDRLTGADMVSPSTNLTLYLPTSMVSSRQFLLDRLAIDVGAAGATQILEYGATIHHLHDGVLAADGGEVVDDDVASR